VEHPFDRAHGVDTGGYLPGEQLASGLGAGRSVTSSEFFNTAYYGISPSTLRHALSLLPEPAGHFAFVDLGCGKGRALLVAAEFLFASIVGVELSQELCELAAKNTAREARIRIEHSDAAHYRFPPEPLVIFLYHPFLRPVLRRVLRSLGEQLRRSPRPVYLLYANPGYQSTISRFPWLEQVWDYSFPLSDEDAAADRHGITHERYTLYKAGIRD
jgi:SAM-dependent methyltransferase